MLLQVLMEHTDPALPITIPHGIITGPANEPEEGRWEEGVAGEEGDQKIRNLQN